MTVLDNTEIYSWGMEDKDKRTEYLTDLYHFYLKSESIRAKKSLVHLNSSLYVKFCDSKRKCRVL